MGAFSSGFQLGTYERVRKSTAQMRFFLSNIQGTLPQHISSFEPQCLFRLIEIFRKTSCPLSISDVSINFVQLTALSTISLYTPDCNAVRPATFPERGTRNPEA